MRPSLFAIFAAILSLSLAVPLPHSLDDRNTPLNDFLSILLDHLPTIDGTIDSVAGILTTFEQLLAMLTMEPTTYNELSASSCKPYTVLFARGTTEPGNVGILVGPPFFAALKDQVGEENVAIQGVNGYSATISGYLAGGDPAGSASMASQIRQAKQMCSDTQLIVGGYSQGGQIVHNAVGMLDVETASWISKIVIFGDPDHGEPFTNILTSNVDVYCNPDDNICVNGVLILPAHLTYGLNAMAAAAFVATVV